MSSYSSYYLYEKYEKRGNGNWIPSYPNTFSVDGDGTMSAITKIEDDTACGYIPSGETQYRWNVVDGYVCDDCDVTKVKIDTSGDTYYVSGSGEVTRAEVSGYVSAATDAVITNYATSIGDYAFSGFSGVEFIRIPSTVTSIGNSAFNGCSAMTECQIPYGCTSIGTSAFTICVSLMFVDIPNTVTSLGDYCFRDCKNFRYVSIPSSITSIPNNCFENCDGLSDIELPSSITSIGNSAFSNCSSLYSVTVLATTPPTLGSEVFYNVNQILKIYVPCDSVDTYKVASGWSSYTDRIRPIQPCTPTGDTKLVASYSDGQVRFRYCDSSTELTSATTKPSGYQYSAMTSAEIGDCVTSIDYGAFSGCTSLTNIDIPSGVTSIGNNAFEYCWGLTSINIPSGVTSIGIRAFNGCSSLTNCTIGSGVTSIGNHAFLNCNHLTSITVLASTPPTLGSEVFYGTNSNLKIYVPTSSVDTYKSASGWRTYSTKIYPIE